MSERSASTDGDTARAGDRNLAVAIVVGVVLAGLFVGTVLWHPVAFTSLVGLLVAVAILESGRVIRATGRVLAVPVVLVAALLMLAGAHAAGATGQLLGVLVLFLGAVTWELVDPQRRRVLEACGTTLLLGLWVGLPASYAALLVTRPTDGSLAAIAVIGAAVFADIGAYAAGSLLGRHRIAPSVSPNKTWEGLAGGLVLPAAVAALVLPPLGGLFTAASAAAVALLAGLAAFLGDLVESMVKRDLQVKDLGAVLPAHGGVLDRVDGILLALPVGYYAVELVV